MKVSYQWLSEYIDLNGHSAEELAEKLTRSGIEVDIVESLDKGVEKVVVGYVKSRVQHPDADKLGVCIVDAGTGEDLQIVCGAKNVAAGQKVPVAIVGAKLPGDLKIKKAKLRGVESQGMICSAKELGLNDKLLPKEMQEGILVLPENTELGADVNGVLGIGDKVMELDLTPNRSDCLSMIGVAYEIAAILGREIKLPDEMEGLEGSAEDAGSACVGDSLRKAEDLINVQVSSPDHCPHYTVRVIENVTIGPSPQWMRNRLMAAGIRPINNVVDITNYVMLEFGQPLHAFDADRLKGRIDVRLAKDGEKIVTLDDVERTLEPHMLVITDGEKPVGIAGVMGGANSEVTESTKTIILESAKFAGSSIRRTSRQLGLRSEASLRFEKEVNPDAVIPALNRAASLMAKYAGGAVAEGVVQSAPQIGEPIVLDLSIGKVNQHLGTRLSEREVKEIFERLNFPYEQSGEGLLRVFVPRRRGDITRYVDLIEEIARLYGYDRIPTTLMSGETTPGSLTKPQFIRRELRRLLTDSGLHEVVNYSLTHPAKIAEYPGLYGANAKPVALSMPMSEDRSVLRTSLVPQLLDAAAYNRNRNAENTAIFEIGSIFITDEARLTKLPQEKMLLAILWTGARRPAHWSGVSEKADFYDVKGIIEKITGALGIAGVKYAAAKPKGLHPGRTAEIRVGQPEGDILIGLIGQVHPELQQRKDLEDTFVAELELDVLYELADSGIRYRALPRYPSIGRDLAVVVDSGLEVGRLIDKVRETAGELLESVRVFDIYKGERLGEGKKSVALSLVYRNPDRTLTDSEVGSLQEKVVQALEQSFQAQLRR
ncbi:phenylalanine--tRNA ligase subunit beta [Ferviditalea candida]|uniref:Phenylalanine--tRNA ligase beta subunit n=1 Tax=Ferviditalea candida TaxID=3108399 RepID=A0ABU5ZGU0_9BACL|nr:phenylalanine--tRNA ligase subunit beta [Paenibacillaceae bacterium T2]